MTSLEYIEYLQRKLGAANQTYRKLDRYDDDAMLIKKQKAEIKRLTKEIERLKDENCHDYHCMCLAQQEKAELQKQVDELLIDKGFLIAELDDARQVIHRLQAALVKQV